MSDNALRYVPINPSYQPSATAARDAEMTLKAMFPAAEAIVARFSEEIGFIDAGGNWDGVRCPACGADAESWWSDAMDVAAESKFRDLNTSTRCCGANVSLNDLDYRWPVAFGRFVLEAFNPNAAGLSAAQLHVLSTALGCELREVKVHI
jgi:hypothetical protein